MFNEPPVVWESLYSISSSIGNAGSASKAIFYIWAFRSNSAVSSATTTDTSPSTALCCGKRSTHSIICNRFCFGRELFCHVIIHRVFIINKYDFSSVEYHVHICKKGLVCKILFGVECDQFFDNITIGDSKGWNSWRIIPIMWRRRTDSGWILSFVFTVILEILSLSRERHPYASLLTKKMMQWWRDGVTAFNKRARYIIMIVADVDVDVVEVVHSFGYPQLVHDQQLFLSQQHAAAP